ncbi:hypothetical protein D3C78_1587760 [compost metagenome]
MRGQTARCGVRQRKHASHALHGLVDDGQPQACARGSGARRVATEERLGQARQLLGRYALAAVANAHHHTVFTRLGRDFDLCGVGIRALAVAARIFQQIGHHAREFHFVSQHVKPFRHVHADLQFTVVLHRVDAG